MDYWQVYQRNIGLFTREQQEILQSAKVFFAGVGGVGGIEAATLARFGIGELVIVASAGIKIVVYDPIYHG